MTNVLNYQNRRPFNYYVWSNGNKDKFHSRKVAISFMQLTEGLLVNMNTRINPQTIKK